jgi:FtsP/CotA-like multicopper oxidase with cupredoxin domain
VLCRRWRRVQNSELNGTGCRQPALPDMRENVQRVSTTIRTATDRPVVQQNSRIFGAQEAWLFINTTDDAHPIHLHLLQFRV